MRRVEDERGDMMSGLFVESFTHMLVNDVSLADARLAREDTPTHRRELEAL